MVYIWYIIWNILVYFTLQNLATLKQTLRHLTTILLSKSIHFYNLRSIYGNVISSNMYLVGTLRVVGLKVDVNTGLDCCESSDGNLEVMNASV